jgi:CBS domain-containing protein
MSIGEICTRSVQTAQLNDAVSVAAQRMLEHSVGTLIVVDKELRALGIVTDRDLALRLIAESRDLSRAEVWEVMTQLPRTVGEEMSIEEALGIMRSGHYRRLPVVNRDGHLVGLVSVDDILALVAKELGEIAALLRAESPKGPATQ